MYKENFGNIPNKDKVRSMVEEAYKKNPGSWIIHAHVVGKTAEKMAKEIGLDPDIAYACAYLHNIGESSAYEGMRSLIEAFRILRSESYFFPARIALGYSFVDNDIRFYGGDKNISDRDLEIIKNFLRQREIGPYDRLIMALDNLIGEDYLGFEKRKLEKESIDLDPEFRQKREEIIRSYIDDLEKILEKPIKSYLPRPKYYKFPYNLFSKDN